LAAAAVLALLAVTAGPAAGAAAQPASKFFDEPKGPHGYPLLACLEADSKHCGDEAALAFCRSRGFARAGDYETTNSVLPRVETITGALCSAAKCKVLQSITCLR
ncbi:MAG: hypothetical protein IRY94_16565, partial [Rhodospirillaceae bacterium]|nr:hypothetical protein [Rhodospirillaceae bacterium]